MRHGINMYLKQTFQMFTFFKSILLYICLTYPVKYMVLNLGRTAGPHLTFNLPSPISAQKKEKKNLDFHIITIIDHITKINFEYKWQQPHYEILDINL